jgi:hypothetical protein
MTDATTKFFEELGQRGYEPLAARGRGTVRFDLVDGRRTESWLVQIDRGNIAVSRGAAEADCVFRGSHELFDQIARGKVNSVAARLRNAITVEGDPRLAIIFQRLFPGPPSSRRGAKKTGRKSQ